MVTSNSIKTYISKYICNYKATFVYKRTFMSKLRSVLQSLMTSDPISPASIGVSRRRKGEKAQENHRFLVKCGLIIVFPTLVPSTGGWLFFAPVCPLLFDLLPSIPKEPPPCQNLKNKRLKRIGEGNCLGAFVSGKEDKIYQRKCALISIVR